MTYAEPVTGAPAEPPRVSRLQAVVTVALGLIGAGVLAGAAWAWLAPPIAAVIGLTRGGERVHGYVGDAADHLFLGAFLLPGLVSVVAVVATAVVWRWRAHRGPAMVGALTVGALAGTAVAAGVGAALARWRWGAVDLASAPVTPENRVFYFFEAPSVFFGHAPLQIAVSIVFPAGMAALAYALCVLSTPRDDLGAWPPVDTPPWPAPVLSGPAATAGDVPPADPGSPSR